MLPMPPSAPTDDTEELPTAPADAEPTEPAGEPDGDEGMGGDPSAQVCIPLAALAQPDDKDQMTPPEMGDKVQWSGEGTVDKIEGDNAYVTPLAINGQKIEAPEEGQSDDDMENQLRSEAATQPGMQ